ncbi:MAG: tetratricopeptide repeat protein [Magnetococcales bacterium]|nr:tetratricopeptide repeat protein [Magnetococcales bacterium]
MGGANPSVGEERLGSSGGLPFLQRMVDLLETEGRLGGAIRYQERLIGGLSATKGGDHPLVLRAQGRLALLLVAEGRREEGRRILEKLEKKMVHILGAHHLETALLRLQQAQVAIFWPERAAEVLKKIDDVQPVLEQALWPDDPRRVDVLSLRASALSVSGRVQEAETAYANALNYCTTQFGASGFPVSQVLEAMGWHRVLAGRFQDGIGDMERALHILERYGRKSTGNRSLNVLGHLAEGYLRWGKKEQALEVMEKMLALMEQRYGKDHKNLAKPLTDLGMVELGLWRLQQAEGHLQQALALVRGLRDQEQLQRSFILTNLGDLYGRQGKREDADRCFSEAETTAALFFADDGVGMANWLASMALILHQGGNADRAQALFAQSLHLLETSLGRDDPAVKKVRESLFLSTQAETLPVIPQTPASPSASMAVAPVMVGEGKGVSSGMNAHEGESSESPMELGLVPVGDSELADVKVMPEPNPKKKDRFQDPSPIAGGQEPLLGGRVVVWQVHLACWPVVGFEAKSMIDSLRKLNIPVRYRLKFKDKKRQYCYYSGSYKDRQGAMDVIRQIDHVISLPELSIQEYESSR